MRLCRFGDSYGIVCDDTVIDITTHVKNAEKPGYGDALVRALPGLRGRDRELQSGAIRLPLSEVALLSPVQNPTKILAAPNNYPEHRDEMHAPGAVKSSLMSSMDEVGFFLKATSSLVGPSEGIAVRFPERRTDYEVEAVIVIGEVVSEPVSASDALRYVAGYGVGLDITLRGPEERSQRKSIDSYSVFGPWLVTVDEVPDISLLNMRLSVNGEDRQSVNLSAMLFNAAEQIAYASQFYTLYPGDLIYTGTPSGVGPIRGGDVIYAEIESIGAMEVKVRNYSRNLSQSKTSLSVAHYLS